MSQRTAAAAQRQEDTQLKQTRHAEVNHLMPPSLRRIPNWFQMAPFQYNGRFMIAFLPGALLVATVTGKLMVGGTVLGVIATLLLRSAGQKYLGMIARIAHIFMLAVLNVYCMTPLIWQSILNLPLFLLFHFFIATSGIWWLIQDEEFSQQDPRFLLLVERMLFAVYPGLCVTMVTWVSAMLFGMASIPYSVAAAGLVSLSLFASPLKSSYAKPNTPTNTGVIQHWSMVLVYVALEMTVPALLYFALQPTDSLHSWLVLCLLGVAPLFLLTLLEAQELLALIRLGPRVIQGLRWVSGIAVMVLLSVVVMISQPSSLLPLLLIPLSFTALSLISALDYTASSPSSHPHPLTTLTLTTITALLSSATFMFLPWSIYYLFSFLSLPLSVVQLLIWGVTMVTIAVVTFTRWLTPSVWIPFNIVFVMCEYVLSAEGVYMSYLALTTASVAAVLFWRLHVLGLLSVEKCLFISSLHMTKLSLLLPSSPSSPPSPLTTSVAIFLLSFLLLRLFLFQSQPVSLSPSQLLVYSVLLCCGLLLGVDSLLSPLWLSFTHQPPSSASLIATILLATGLFMVHGMGLLKSSETDRLSYWPPGLILMSLLLFLFQPQFEPQLLGEAAVIVLTGSDISITNELLLAAWEQLLSWVVLAVAGLVLVAMVTCAPLVSIATTILGGALGAMATIVLLATPPVSLPGFLYALIGGLTGCLLGRAYATPPTRNRRSFTDNAVFIALSILVMLEVVREMMTAPHVYMPNVHWFERVSVPCSRLGMAVFGSISLAFRVKMGQCGEQPYAATASNVSCLLFYLLALLNPLHTQYEVSVVLVSLIFLLLQPDGCLLPSSPSSSLFLAPSLLAASIVLYVLSGTRIIPKVLSTFSKGASLFLATRCLELVCLLASLPGHAVFLYYLWSGRQLHLSVPRLILYILPNAFLPQFGGSPSSTILGIMAVLSFCLIMLGDFASLKLTS